MLKLALINRVSSLFRPRRTPGVSTEAVDIPGYGEAISDPARLPPYTEDLGGGITHEVNTDGSERWYKDGKLHRDCDLPAVIHQDGTQAWFDHGKFKVAQFVQARFNPKH